MDLHYIFKSIQVQWKHKHMTELFRKYNSCHIIKIHDSYITCIIKYIYIYLPFLSISCPKPIFCSNIQMWALNNYCDNLCPIPFANILIKCNMFN